MKSKKRSGNGFVKLHRKYLDHPVINKDADHLSVWIWLLANAVWDTENETRVMFHGQSIVLEPGQLTCGRRMIADEQRVEQGKVRRILKSFENEQLIEQRTDYQCTLISILVWDDDQKVNNELNNECTTTPQKVNNELNTNKEIKKYIKKDKNTKNHHHGGGSPKKVISVDGNAFNSRKEINVLFTQEFIDELWDNYDDIVNVGEMLDACIDNILTTGKQVSDLENYVRVYFRNHVPGGKYENFEHNNEYEFS